MAAAGARIAPLAWIMSQEVFIPARLRGPGSSIAAFTSWISAFIVTKSYLDIQRSLTTAGVFWIYGGFFFLGFIFFAFILPETKGKTPDEIQAIFESKNGHGIYKFVSILLNMITLSLMITVQFLIHLLMIRCSI